MREVVQATRQFFISNRARTQPGANARVSAINLKSIFPYPRFFSPDIRHPRMKEIGDRDSARYARSHKIMQIIIESEEEETRRRWEISMKTNMRKLREFVLPRCHLASCGTNGSFCLIANNYKIRLRTRKRRRDKEEGRNIRRKKKYGDRTCEYALSWVFASSYSEPTDRFVA